MVATRSAEKNRETTRMNHSQSEANRTNHSHESLARTTHNPVWVASFPSAVPVSGSRQRFPVGVSRQRFPSAVPVSGWVATRSAENRETTRTNHSQSEANRTNHSHEPLTRTTHIFCLGRDPLRGKASRPRWDETATRSFRRSGRRPNHSQTTRKSLKPLTQTTHMTS